MTAVGGMNITQTVEGLERYPVNLRYGSELRDTPEKLRRILVPTPSGAQVPIAQLADIRIVKGPPVIKSENARNNAWVYVDLRGIDVGTYVKNAQQTVQEKLDLPPGYSLVWSGQYEYMVRAQKRLMVVVPMTLLIIFLLLYFNFKNMTESLLVMLSVPFSLTGGFWLMYLLGYNMSVAVGVGFIALFGVAVLNGVVLVSYIRKIEKEKGLQPSEAVREAALVRMRPVLMTALVAALGFVPMALAHGSGAEVQRPLATVVIGGLVTSTLLTLFVLPTIYSWFVGPRVEIEV